MHIFVDQKFIYLIFISEFIPTMTAMLPDEFGYVLLSAAIMGFSILLVGFFFAGRVRGKVFTEEYMKKNFGSEHQQVTGN